MTVSELSAVYLLRPRRDTDIPRIFADWLKSYRRERPMRDVPNPVFFHFHHACIETLLGDDTVAWLVACDPSTPDMIAGWACAQQLAEGSMLLHYVYVAQPFRRIGLGTRLLAALGVQPNIGVFVTALSFPGTALLKARGNTAAYNPYLLLGRLAIGNPGRPLRGARRAASKSHRAAARGWVQDETEASRNATEDAYNNGDDK